MLVSFAQYRSDCFESKEKHVYCLIIRRMICSIPLVVLWLFSLVYSIYILKREPMFKGIINLTAHFVTHAVLILTILVRGYFEHNLFLSIIRYFQIFSYAASYAWMSQLSHRLRSTHISFILTFISLTFIKILDANINWECEHIASLDFLMDIIEMVTLIYETSFLMMTERLTFTREHPTIEEGASFASRVFFLWLTKSIKKVISRSPPKGTKKSASRSSCTLNKDASSKYLNEIWTEQWEIEQRKNSGENKDSWLVWPFCRTQKEYLVTVACLRFFSDILNFANPIFLRLLFYHFAQKDQTSSYGFIIVFVMFLANFTKSLLLNAQIGGMLRMSNYFQTMMKNAILRKILKLRSHKNSGEVLKHANSDAESIGEAFVFLQDVWSVPFQVILAMSLLYYELGWPAFAGLLVVLLYIPMNCITSFFIERAKQTQIRIKDERIQLSNETVKGIKVVKLHAWENVLEEKINQLRAQEVSSLRNVCVLSRIVDLANEMSPFLVAIASFACFVFLGEGISSLTPSVAIVALTVCNQLRQPLKMLSNLFSYRIQAKVSNNRLRRFLNLKELEKKKKTGLNDPAITFKNASLNWNGLGKPSVLKKIDAKIAKGQLVAVVGKVGAGKSSFLSAILDEMVLIGGEIKIRGELAYVPQKSWIFDETVKENILFGEVCEKKFFEEICSSCQLSADLFPHGYDTEIGENGVQISDGLRARVALARALYQKKNIYLLDDPLSDVDYMVGQALFDKVIGPDGLLKDETRVLVTHNLRYTTSANRIIVIEDGKIVQHGEFDQLMADRSGHFRKLWEANLPQNEYDWKQEEKLYKEAKREEGKKGGGEGLRKTNCDEQSTESEDGVCSLSFKTTGWFICFCALAFFILHFLIMGYSSRFLLGSSDGMSHIDLYRYAIFASMEMLFIGAGFAVLTIGSLRASYRFHSMPIHSLLRAPVTFFNDKPTGIIINRLSRDLDFIDRLHDSFRIILISSLSVFIFVSLELILIPSVFILALLFACWYLVVYDVLISVRHLRSIERKYRSSVLSTITDSIQGASSIRAFDKTEETIKDFTQVVDNHAECRYLIDMTKQYLSTRSDFVANLWIAEMVNCSVQLINDKQSSELSIERVRQYCNIEPEENYYKVGSIPKIWPHNGNIVIGHYSLKNSAAQKTAHDNFELRINAGEKIGIVGRAGCGKSSLMLALFRMPKPVMGQVIIDGTNISEVGLQQLRSNIIIMPQELVVFSATLRFNIDPFNRYRYADDKLWSCLEICQLRQFASEDEKKLDRYINDGGNDMSVREKRLLCLCRALLRDSKIVIIDEANGPIDTITDDIIQNAISTEFPDSTIITISQRLRKVANSTKIAVLKTKRVGIFDTPSKIFEGDSRRSSHSQLSQGKKKKKKPDNIIHVNPALKTKSNVINKK